MFRRDSLYFLLLQLVNSKDPSTYNYNLLKIGVMAVTIEKQRIQAALLLERIEIRCLINIAIVDVDDSDHLSIHIATSGKKYCYCYTLDRC